MAQRPDQTQPLLPSVLDRLIDDEPTISRETLKNKTQVVRELKASVRRDLQDLLNTRCRCIGWPADFTELEDSLVNYGLPDFSGTHLRAVDEPDNFLDLVAATIRRCEPRLSRVRVELLKNSQPNDRTLRFRIDAYLHVDPVDERVAYQSSLEPTTGNFQVEGGAK